ncbi:hypothetical protein ES703_83871 [subsurface metagenome]
METIPYVASLERRGGFPLCCLDAARVGASRCEGVGADRLGEQVGEQGQPPYSSCACSQGCNALAPVGYPPRF